MRIQQRFCPNHLNRQIEMSFVWHPISKSRHDLTPPSGISSFGQRDMMQEWMRFVDIKAEVKFHPVYLFFIPSKHR